MTNWEVKWYAPLELEINRHRKKIDIVVTNLNYKDIFLDYN